MAQKGRFQRGRPAKVDEDQDLRVAQGALMATHSLLGRSRSEIAEMFKVSPATVSKRVQEASRSEIFQQAMELVHRRLLPKAMAIYDVELEQGNFEAAQDVMHGIGVLQKGGTVKVEVADPLADLRAEYLKESEPDAEIS